VKDDRLYLIHMGECIARIEQYVEGNRDTFMHSSLIQDAVLRNLQTLRQSAARVSSALRDTHPEVNWRGIIGLRNVLVHDYLGISLVRIWEIVERDLPDLQRQVETMIQAWPGAPSDGHEAPEPDAQGHSP
jgi:uncharacterized protein with HEPN domain